MKRSEVYSLIDGEREYQERKWGKNKKDSVGDFITYIKAYVDRAIIRGATEAGWSGALEEVRKIAALSVSCMEQHDTQPRYEPVKYTRKPAECPKVVVDGLYYDVVVKSLIKEDNPIKRSIKQSSLRKGRKSVVS
jgi:hypothetical protein